MSEGAGGSAPRRPTLELERGGERCVLELLGRSTVLGASDAADLVLAAPGVAPQHVRFEREGDRIFAIALDEQHPLRVQGVERKEWLLRDGDEVRLGELALVFRWADARAESAATALTPALAPPRVDRAPVPPPVLPAPRISRTDADAEPRERREGARPGWPWPAKAFFVLVIAAAAGVIWSRTRGGSSASDLPAPSAAYKDTEGLEPFFYYSIYPVSERLESYPDAARLVAQRCQVLLAECSDPRTRVLLERALSKARARSFGASWTYAEMIYATEQAPSGGRAPEYFREEKRSILQAFLASNPNAADRFVAEQKLKQL